MKRKKQLSSAAFNMLELLLALICLLAAITILLPALARPRNHRFRLNCTNNLKQIGLSFRTWALDHNDKYPMGVSVTNGGTKEMGASGIAYIHFEVLSNELSTPRILCCPQDNARTNAIYFGTRFIKYGEPFNGRHLSYFVGLDASQTFPNMFLAGDRNLTNDLPLANNLLILTKSRPGRWTRAMHDRMGNVALADGSVQQFSNSAMATAIGMTGTTNNRLQMP